jgi:BASS family bile acid:Na+ symporter
VRVLGFLGRYATRFLAGGLLLGIVFPPLATLAKPLLVPTLLIPLTLALVRLDWRAMAAYRQRPKLAAALLVWLLAVSPLLVWLVTTWLQAFGLPAGLRQALVLMAASSPIVSSVAIALLVGLDATLAIVAVLLATALVPFTLPLMALALLGLTLDIGVGAFMMRLGLFIAAWMLRRWIPESVLAARTDVLDGLTVVNLLLFGLAIMDGVTVYALERPAYVGLAILAAFAFNLLLQAAGAIAFGRLPRRAALTVGLLSGNCNMGLVLVALQGKAEFEVTIFFALAQVPMYVLPALLEPVYRRLLRREAKSR